MFIQGHVLNLKGSDHPAWRGRPRTLTVAGYFRPWIDGRNVLEHRLVIEKYLGRELDPGEVVHHIDGDRTNNNLDNLQVFASQAEHARHHRQEVTA